MSKNRKRSEMQAMQRVELADGSRVIRVARAKPTPSSAEEVATISHISEARAAALIFAENRLRPWAKWAKENRSEIGYPTISLLYRAMQSTKVGIIRGAVMPEIDDEGNVHYPLSAGGSETRSMRPREMGEVDPAIVEVDQVVAKLPSELHEVLVADYFTYGPMEVRCRETRYRLSRFRQLLEAAKYAVYMGLSVSA